VRICISNDTTCRTLRRANSARVVCRVVHAVSAVIHRPAIDFSAVVRGKAVVSLIFHWLGFATSADKDRIEAFV